MIEYFNEQGRGHKLTNRQITERFCRLQKGLQFLRVGEDV